MNRSADIKNLCIALEALSRIPDSGKFTDRIRDLLSDAIHEEETKPTQKLYQPPTRPEPDFDNEIPF